MTKKKKGLNSYIKLLMWLAVGGVIGAFVGIGMVMAEDGVLLTVTGISSWITANIVLIMGTLVVISLIICVICYGKAEQVVKECLANEDDDRQDELDKRYDFWGNLGITGSSIIIYLTLGLMAFSLRIESPDDAIKVLLSAGLLLAAVIICSAYQVAAVKQMKRKDPLKRGDAADMKFAKEWLESCDEMEKRVIYEASYRTMKVTRTILMAATVIAITGEMFLGTGLAAVVLLTLCNVISAIIYSYYSVKLEKTSLVI